MFKWLFFLALGFLTLGQFSSISKGGGANVYLFDIYIIVITSFLTLWLLAKKRFMFPKYLLFFFVFGIFAMGITLLKISDYNIFQFSTSIMYLVRFFSYVLFASIVWNLREMGYINTKNIEITFMVSGVLVALFGFVQLLLIPDLEVLDKSLGWDPHKNRLFSTFFDPNFTGAYLVLCFTLLLDGIASGRNLLKQKIIYFIAFILVLGIFFTFSRSAWLMLSIVILIYGVFKYRFLLFISFILMFLAYFAVPRVQTRISGITDPADSARFRFISWENTSKIIADNFFFGTGFNTLRYVQKEYGFLALDDFTNHSGAGSDSSLLFVFATTGLFGFIIFIYSFLFPIFDLFRMKSSRLLFIFSACLSLLVDSQFINALFYPQIMLFWMLIFSVFTENNV